MFHRASGAVGVAALLALSLACGGLPGAEPQAAAAPSACADRSAVPIRFAGSSAHLWPVADTATHVVSALDADPATTWKAATDEIGTFFPVSGSVSAVRVDTGAATVEVRAFAPGRLRAPVPAAWQSAPVVDGVACVVLEPAARAVEVRVPGGGDVSQVALLADAPVVATPLDAWRILGERSGDGTLLAEAANARIGELDWTGDACVARKPFPPPDADLRGTCARRGGGIALSGELPSIGPIDEVVTLREIDACLVLVDGWPLSRC